MPQRCPSCGHDLEPRQLYCLKCRRPIECVVGAPPLEPESLGLIRMAKVILPPLIPPLLFAVVGPLFVFNLIAAYGVRADLMIGGFLLLLLSFLPLYFKRGWLFNLFRDLRDGGQYATVRFLRKNRHRTATNTSAARPRYTVSYSFEWVGDLRTAEPGFMDLEEGAEYDILFLPGLGLIWNAVKVKPAVWASGNLARGDSADLSQARLSVDGGRTLFGPAPAQITAALEGFNDNVDLDTQSWLGRFSIAWLNPAQVMLTHYGGVSIRTIGPLTLPQANLILQRAAGGDADWELGVEWDESESATHWEEKKIVLVQALLFVDALLILWLIYGLANDGRQWLVRMLDLPPLLLAVILMLCSATIAFSITVLARQWKKKKQAARPKSRK